MTTISKKITVIGAEEKQRLIQKGLWPISDRDERKGLGAIRAYAADFLCTFSAPKKVRIGRRQGKLAAFAGLLYWILVLGIIVVYVIIYGVVINNNHLSYEPPMGSVRIGLRRPTEVDPKTKHFCNPAHHDCRNNFTSILALPYCMNNWLQYKGGTKRKCRLWDEDSVVTRNVGTDVQIGTYVRVWEQIKVCDGTDKAFFQLEAQAQNDRIEAASCPRTFNTQENETFYLADVENFVVTIHHSVRTLSWRPTPKSDITGRGLRKCEQHKKPSEMNSTFEQAQVYLASYSRDCHHIQPDYHLSDDPSDPPDAFLLGDLLKAAHVNLDQDSTAQENATTRREAGTMIVLTIKYENRFSWTNWLKALVEELPLSYEYTVREIPVDENMMRNVHWDEVSSWNGHHRRVVETHGIRLTVLFTGKIGSWSWYNLLVILVVSTTALTYAEKVVTYLLMFAPNSVEDGGVTASQLAHHFQDNAPNISQDWEEVLKDNLERDGGDSSSEGEDSDLEGTKAAHGSEP
eukprot:TRINITY_DN6973_c0_g1_i1.p1 TRINITY_DN6973_c0_g1~~TRINITY_DN6973_c0_g1_i1.p1  ORF type:complete len:517 (-),score=59.66 TRINITY_DN6973_c0_g1_i1:228-1778(-)